MAGQIHRQKKNREFVTIDTHCLRNKELKWDAKGLHSYLMQLPDDWKINISDLENRGADGRDATTSPMKALLQSGYIYREQTFDEKGRFEGYDYHLFERPEHGFDWLYENGKPVNGFSENGKPATNKELSSSKKKNSKNEGRGDESKKTTPTQEQFNAAIDEREARLEAKKEKAPPIAPTPPKEQTYGDHMRTIESCQHTCSLNMCSLDDWKPGGKCEKNGCYKSPAHTVKTIEPGNPVTVVEGIAIEPGNPIATAALFNRMGLQPKATNGDEADAIITAWAAENLETVKSKYNRAKRTFTPGDLDKLIVKFCGQYASNKDTGTRERFLYDPARFFNDKITSWLLDQPGFEKMAERKNETKKAGTPNAFGGDQEKYLETQKF